MLGKRGEAKRAADQAAVFQYLEQVLERGRQPKFTLLDREYNHVDELQIGGRFAFDGSQRHDALYIFGNKLYYIDYDASQMQPRDRIPLAERRYDGKMYEHPNGTAYDRNSHRLVPQDQITKVGNNLYYPDFNKPKLDFSKKKTANNQFFEINGTVYEKKGSLFINVRQPEKIYTEEGIPVRQLNNHRAEMHYPIKQEDINQLAKKYGDKPLTSDPNELKIDTSSRAFYVQITDPSLNNPGSQAKAITVDLNITSPETGATEKHRITLQLEENNPNVPPATYRSELLLLTNYGHRNGKQLAAEPGSEISITYVSPTPSTRVENGVTVSEAKTITAPVGKVPVEKVLEMDLFIVVDDDIDNKNAIQENALKEKQALAQIEYAKKEWALAGVEIKVNGPFYMDKSRVYSKGTESFADPEIIAAMANEQYSAPKDATGKSTHLKMIVGAGLDGLAYNSADATRLAVAANTLFIDSDNRLEGYQEVGAGLAARDRVSLTITEMLVEPILGFNKVEIDGKLTKALADTAKKSSLMTDPPAPVQTQKATQSSPTPALTP